MPADTARIAVTPVPGRSGVLLVLAVAVAAAVVTALGLVPASPAAAAPLSAGPLTVATDCARGGTVTMRATPLQRSRVRVVVRARGLAEGSAWTGSVAVRDREAGEQTFRRTAADRTWRVRTVLRAGAARSNEVVLSSSSGRRSCAATITRTPRQVEVEGGCHAAGGYSRLTTSRTDGRARVRAVWRGDDVERWQATLSREYQGQSTAKGGRVDTALDGSASLGDRGRLRGLRSVQVATRGTAPATRDQRCHLAVAGRFRG